MLFELTNALISSKTLINDTFKKILRQIRDCIFKWHIDLFTKHETASKTCQKNFKKNLENKFFNKLQKMLLKYYKNRISETHNRYEKYS